MTCQELQCYLENPLRVEVYMYRESLPATVSEHLAECIDCARLFEEQKALGIGLEMARDAAPEVPVDLDAKVLADYRRSMREPALPDYRRVNRFSGTWVRWGVAAVVVLAVAAAAYFLLQRRAPITAQKIAPVEEKTPATVTQNEPVASAKKQFPAESPKQEVSARRVRKTAGVTNSSPLPPGFTSLMYCDEMTCTGALEVVRVELPPSPEQATGAAAAPVMAEVLVGADGIARGIRIVQ